MCLLADPALVFFFLVLAFTFIRRGDQELAKAPEQEDNKAGWRYLRRSFCPTRHGMTECSLEE